jgi:hypothetical protein
MIVSPVFDAQSAIWFNSPPTQRACTWRSLSCALVFSGSGRKSLPIFVIPVLVFVTILSVVFPVGIAARQLRDVFSLILEFMRTNGWNVDSQLVQDFFNRLLLALCFGDSSPKENSAFTAVPWPIS